MQRQTLFHVVAILGLLLVYPTPGVTQTSMEGGPRMAAMGGAGTGLPGDVWGVVNPASWSTLPGGAIALFGTQAFNLPEMRLAAVRYVQPTPWVAVAVGAQTYGFDAFRESRFSLGAARGFRFGATRVVHVALHAQYVHVDARGYGNAGAMGLSAGALLPLTSTVHAGFYALNINQPMLDEHDELPRHLAVGLGYELAPSVRLAADLVKDVRFPLSVRAGLEGQLVEVFLLRAGIATEPVRFTTGASIHLGGFSADVAAEQHEVLGWSPAVAMGFSW